MYLKYKWSDNDIEILKSMVDKGFTAKEMSETKLKKFSVITIRDKLKSLKLNYARKIRKTWNKKDIRKLRKLAKDGLSNYELADIFKVSYPVILNVCKNLGISVIKARSTPPETEKRVLKELKKNKLNFGQIATNLNVHKTAVRTIAIKHGIKSIYTETVERREKLKEEGKIECHSCFKIFDLLPSKYKILECPDCLKKRIKITYKKKRKSINSDIKELINSKLIRSKCRAKSKKIGFNLTIKFILSLYENQNHKCYYSGLEMTTKMVLDGEIETGISIDRINSNKGYTKGNVVLCCAFINAMKLNLPKKYFIEVCRLIAENHKIKPEQIHTTDR